MKKEDSLQYCKCFLNSDVLMYWCQKYNYT
jgi:hypothetical protein